MKKIVFFVSLFFTVLLSFGSSLHALSFIEGTKFLDANTKSECDALWGNFTEWYEEIYCTTSGIYPDAETFLKAEWNTCSVATDGCNTVQIWEGKLGAMTQMYCEDIYGEHGQEEWSCLDASLEHQELWFLSYNDRTYYKLLRDETLSQSRVEHINSILEEFSQRGLERYNYNMIQSLWLLERAVERFEDEIFNLVMSYPADVWMSEADTLKYSILHYAKFELMITAERWKRNSSM